MPRYTIDITDEAEYDLAYYRAYERKAIIDGIITHLSNEPDIETANRKRLRDNPVARWELRIGRYRAFMKLKRKHCLIQMN